MGEIKLYLVKFLDLFRILRGGKDKYYNNDLANYITWVFPQPLPLNQDLKSLKMYICFQSKKTFYASFQDPFGCV